MDFFSKVAEFLDEHSEKFTDGEYKEMIELVAKQREKRTKFYIITAMCPSLAGPVISWEKYKVTVALNSDDETLVKASRLIHSFMLFGKHTHTLMESDIFDISTNLLPVVQMDELDPSEEFRYMLTLEMD